MMSTKKAQSIVISTALVFLLTACGDTSIESKPTVSVENGSSSSSENSALNTAGLSEQIFETSIQSTPKSSRGTPYISAGNVSADASYTPPNKDGNGEVSGSILVLDGGRAMMLYDMDRELGHKYAAAVNKYKEQLGGNVNVYSMIVPTQLSFYLPENCSDLSDDEAARIADIYGNMDGIIPIDVFSALKDRVNEDIYYRTDHHWTQLGAYYAAREFAQTALVPFDELSEFEKHEKENYLGSFFGGSSEHPEIKNNPETFVWYIPKREVIATYYDKEFKIGEDRSYFLDPNDIDAPSHWLDTYAEAALAVRVNTGLDTGRKLLMIKDSYADMLAPSLFGSFDEIWIADMRFCGTSTVQLARDKGITDVLFCCSACSAMGEGSYYLGKIM